MIFALGFGRFDLTRGGGDDDGGTDAAGWSLGLTVAAVDAGTSWVSFVMDESARSLDGVAGTLLGGRPTLALLPGTGDLDSWFDRGWVALLRESDELGGRLGGMSLDDEAAAEEDADEDGTVRAKGLGPFDDLAGPLEWTDDDVKLDTVDDLRSDAVLSGVKDETSIVDGFGSEGDRTKGWIGARQREVLWTEGRLTDGENEGRRNS